MNPILPEELDFSTLSTKNKPMLKFRNKPFTCRKKARNAEYLREKYDAVNE